MNNFDCKDQTVSSYTFTNVRIAEITDEDRRLVQPIVDGQNFRRNVLCMAGIDNLVRDGEVPWGAFFGYVATAKPGFLVKHAAQAEAIVRAFDLGVSLTAQRTARVLRDEGHFGPNGTVKWSARVVTSIWKRETYTGHILYRRTRTHRDPVSGRLTTFMRPIEEHQRGFNESLAIVSEKQFQAVAEAQGRGRREKRAPLP